MRHGKLRDILLFIGCWLAVCPSAFGQDAKPKPIPKQVSKLIRNLKSPQRGIRASAAEALGQMGAAASAATPDLAAALKDNDSDVRHTAAFALGAMGFAASAAAPALADAVGDADSLVRYNAASALKDIAKDAEKQAGKMDAPTRAKAMTLWRDAQARLDSHRGKEAIARAVSADAVEDVHHLVKFLQGK